MTLYGSLPFDTRVLREARVLSSHGYDVTVLDIDWELGDRQTDIKRDTIIKIPRKKRTSFWGLMRFWFASLREMLRRRESIDIIHAHDLTGLPPAFVYALMNPRTKLVYDSHELSYALDIGKSTDWVHPVTYTFPSESIEIPVPISLSEPPMNVEY